MLTEIRDNSIHFFNRDFELSRQVLEIGTASIRNYVALSREWFGVDLSEYNLFIMPMAFVRNVHTADGVTLNGQERQLLEYLQTTKDNTVEDPGSDYSVALEVDLRLKRTSGDSFAAVRITNDPEAVAVRLEEEDFRDRYPWSYEILCTQLSNRYGDFLQNKKYYRIRKTLEQDPRFCRERLLDPSNPSGTKKRFYSPGIVREFDGHYRRKS